MRSRLCPALLALSLAACTAGLDEADASLMDGSIPAEGGVMCAADFECDDRVEQIRDGEVHTTIRRFDQIPDGVVDAERHTRRRIDQRLEQALPDGAGIAVRG